MAKTPEEIHAELQRKLLAKKANEIDKKDLPKDKKEK
jgi:hypothetical protein